MPGAPRRNRPSADAVPVNGWGHAGDLLSALLDGELDAAEAARVRAHVDGCRDCRAELDAVTAARSWVRELAPVDPPAYRDFMSFEQHFTYPLRRSGRFTQLPADEQRTILGEHGAIGMSFGAADYAHDIRLACHGLDKDDNDFVVGLIGKELYPLSAIVQTMRKTQQTSLYLERLGPFFVGRAVWQSRH